MKLCDKKRRGLKINKYLTTRWRTTVDRGLGWLSKYTSETVGCRLRRWHEWEVCVSQTTNLIRHNKDVEFLKQQSNCTGDVHESKRGLKQEQVCTWTSDMHWEMEQTDLVLVVLTGRRTTENMWWQTSQHLGTGLNYLTGFTCWTFLDVLHLDFTSPAEIPHRGCLKEGKNKHQTLHMVGTFSSGTSGTVF